MRKVSGVSVFILYKVDNCSELGMLAKAWAVIVDCLLYSTFSLDTWEFANPIQIATNNDFQVNRLQNAAIDYHKYNTNLMPRNRLSGLPLILANPVHLFNSKPPFMSSGSLKWIGGARPLLLDRKGWFPRLFHAATFNSKQAFRTRGLRAFQADV